MENERKRLEEGTLTKGEEGKVKRRKEPKEHEEKKLVDKKQPIKRIETDDEDQENENQPTLIDIIRKEEDRGYQKGNKPRIAKTRYQERREEIPKEELRSNATSTFISHNVNKDKWWNDPQIKKEDWRTKNLTKYILSKSAETFHTIQEIREEQPSKAMKMIQRVMMQMHSRTRNTNTDEEEQLIDFKGWLCLEALKIQAPIGNLRTVKMIMKSIESTFINSNEFLILKAEISVRTREWREAAMAINGTGNNKEVMKEDWVNRIAAVKEKIKENYDLEKRNKLISNSNQYSRNLLEEDEEINNATKMMWNRDYQEATDAACIIWTRIMSNSAPQMI
jgi:hypothetical protein